MKTKKLLVLDGNGLQELTLQMRPLAIDDKVINSLSESVTRQVHRVFLVPETQTYVSMKVSGSMVGLTIPLLHIQLRCPFLMNDKKELYACFNAGKPAPNLSLKWEVPNTMKLSIVLLLSGTYSNIQKHYLVAEHSSEDRILFRLPLPNLDEAAGLCAGKYQLNYSDYLSAARAAVNQFNNSAWNTDLYGRGAHDETGPAQLFKFKPKGEAEMEQINDLGDWRKVSTTVSDSTLEMYYAH